MTEPLTPLERRVYHYLIDFLAENTYQHSIREIAKKFRIKSTKTVSDLLASPSTRAKDGDIVAARLGDEATIKTLTHRGSTIVLEPANDGERALEVGPRDDFAVLGVVCGVFRPFMEETVQPTLSVVSEAE